MANVIPLLKIIARTVERQPDASVCIVALVSLVAVVWMLTPKKHE